MDIGSLKELKKLIPINCICGPGDTIHGLVSNCFPKGIDDFMEQGGRSKPGLSLESSCRLFINNCSICVPKFLESRIQEAMIELYGKEKVVVKITEIKLRITCHNQWTFINTVGLKNFTTLKSEDNILRCNAILTVDNVVLGTDTPIIFVLEYTVSVVREGVEEQIQLVMADYVCFPQYDGNNNLFLAMDVADEMNTDDNASILGTHFWTPKIYQGEKWSLILICQLSPTQGKKADANSSSLAEEKKKLEEIKRSLEEQKRKYAEEKDRQFIEKQKSSEIYSNNLKFQEGELFGTSSYDSKLGKEKNPDESRLYDSEEPNLAVFTQPEDRKLEPIEEEAELSKYQVDVEEDRANPLKICSIIFEFLAYKPKGVFLTYEELIPKKFCFSFKFFNLPTAYTQAVTPIKAQNAQDDIELPQPLRLIGEIGKWTNISSIDPEGCALRLQFDVDPNLDADIPWEIQQDDFLRYLAKTIAKFYVWDAESMLPFGYFKVYLADLLKQSQLSKTIKKEYDIYNDDKEIIGVMQLSMQNIGRRPGEIQRVNKELQKVATENPKGKKKIRSKPLTNKDLAQLPQMSLLIQNKFASNPAATLNDLSLKYKSEQVYNYMAHRENIKGEPPWMKEGSIEEVEKYRTMSRVLNLAEKMEQTVIQKEKMAPISYSLGQLALYPVVFNSSYDFKTVFDIVITDPDGINDFQLVTDPDEWKFFCMKENYEPPLDWMMLSQKGKFSMEANERVVLVFKFLCLKPPIIKKKTLQMKIYNADTQKLEQGNEISITYKETYLNGEFVFNEPENKYSEISLYPDILSKIFEKATHTRCNDPNVVVTIGKNTLHFNLLIPQSPLDTELYICAYADEYCYQSVGIFYALIRSHKCLDINEFAGKKVIQNITLTSNLIFITFS